MDNKKKRKYDDETPYNPLTDPFSPLNPLSPVWDTPSFDPTPSVPDFGGGGGDFGGGGSGGDW